MHGTVRALLICSGLLAATALRASTSKYASVTHLNSLPTKHMLQPSSVISKLKRGIACLSIPLLLSVGAIQVRADDSLIPAYFGVGCFWHVQHEFVSAEKSILGRSPESSTSLTGYAGGKSLGKNGKVCYHNLLRDSEYGDLGHGEVVGLSVPAEKIESFATAYFELFDANGDRPDKGDRGPEYRSLLGLPGGVNSPYFSGIKKASIEKEIKLVEGKGNDADTLGKKVVWVMDSDKFPFYQAEVYHQFHDGFMPGEQYPETYNAIRQAKTSSGELKETGCPEFF